MTIGPYEVLEELAPGPHGARRVKACIPQGQPVLLSLGKPRGGSLEHDRYERLAACLEGLECAHILQLYDHGSDFLALELGEAGPWDRSLQSFPQLLEALGAAHRKGVVHTELRPAWILHTQSGLKVDFTPVLQGGEEPDLLEVLPYMAPEQAQAAAGEDPRVDVYALGVLLHEAATGRRPFEGANPVDVIDRILHAPVPDDPALPLGLVPIVRRALAKEPEARFQSIEEFERELSHQRAPLVELEAEYEPVTVSPPRRSSQPFFQSRGVPRIASSDWLTDEEE